MSAIPIRFLINTLSVVGAAFALWKGGRAERSAALVVIANVLVGQLDAFMGPSGDSVLRLVNDGATAMILLGITVRYGALWMGGVMLFYAAQFAMHSYYLVTQRPAGDYLNALINNINFVGINVCLIVGAAVAWHRRARAARRVAQDAAA
jgi:hypothetical protein